jgi:hypothetical protein
LQAAILLALPLIALQAWLLDGSYAARAPAGAGPR